MSLTFEKLQELRELREGCDAEKIELGEHGVIERYHRKLLFWATDLFDAAELAVAPTNVAAKKFLDALDRVKVLELKVAEQERTIQSLQTEIELAEKMK